MELLGDGDLFGAEIPGSPHGRPGGGGMAAAQVLAILGSMALAAVGRGQGLGDREPAMRQRLLAFPGLVAIEAGHAHPCVTAALELMHDGRSFAAMALRTLAGGADEIRHRLLNLNFGTQAVNHESRDDQRAPDHDGNENRAEGHRVSLLMKWLGDDPS